MDFKQVLENRFSVRDYSDKKVEKEKIQKILETAKMAPTAKNLQPQQIFVIKSKQALDDFKQYSDCNYNAPLAFVICYDKNQSWKSVYGGKEFGDIDASIVTTYMMLEATNQGLGSTWIGLFNPQKVSQILNLKDNILPLSILLVGYPSEECKPSDRHFLRKDLEETTKWL